MNHVRTLFSPRSIAVIGASTKVGSVGHSLTENLLKNGYQGEVYPVNPKTRTLFDRPCYPNLEALPEVPELAIIVIPAAAVPQVLEDAGEKGIKAAIIISSGFKETGEDGAALEKKIEQIARSFGIALLGPNCLGFLNPKIGLNASFAKELPERGNIAFFSQSGALATALLDLAKGKLGFDYFVSLGNKATLDEHHLIDFFAQEKSVELIGFYTESMTKSDEIIRLGRELLSHARPKLALALKSGQTAAGAGASSSHTGSLAGSAEAYRALFRQARITQAETLEELFHLLLVFSQNPLPRGNRLTILSNAGGLGVLATDAATLAGLEVTPPSEKAQDALRAFLPPAASVKNPIDILGDANALRYRQSLEVLAHDKESDMLLVIVTPQTTTEARQTAEAIVHAKKTSGKPVVAIFSGAASLQEGKEILEENHVATLLYPEAGVRALGALAEAAYWRETHEKKKEVPSTLPRYKFHHARAARVIQNARAENRQKLREEEVAEILEAYGFPLLKSIVVKSTEAAHEISQKWREGLYALKIVSPDIVHKSDVGGVTLGVPLQSIPEEYERLLRRVKRTVPLAEITGVLVMEMARPGGTEILLGMKKEPGLGSLIAVGLGGIYVEILKDVSYRFAPLTRDDAEEMLDELKLKALLSGARGQKSVDRDELLHYVGRFSALVHDFPEISEIDINPLLAFPRGEKFAVLDARMRLTDERENRSFEA